MANKYARGVGGNWSADATWSTTSGGTADTTKPVAGDTALLDANSGQVTIDVASACAIVDCTGYTNTLTQSADMTTTGSITFVSGMTFTVSSGTWSVNGAATITTAGKAFGAFTFAGTATYTLADTLNVDGTLTSNTGVTATLATSNIIASGSLTNNGIISGQTITLDGTGTWSGTNILKSNITINTAGTITLANGSTVWYSTGTFTYTAGTVTTTGNTFALDDDCTLNTNGITFNNFTIGNSGDPKAVTLTLSSALTVNGTLDLNIGNVTHVLSASGITINAKGNVTWTGGNTGSVDLGGANLTINGTGNQSVSFRLLVGGTLTINSTGGTITFVNHSVGYNGLGDTGYTTTMTYTAGTVSAGTSTFSNFGPLTMNTSGMSWNNITIQGGTMTLSSALDVNGNLTIDVSTTINCAGYQLNVGGNFTRNGTFTHGSNTIVFDGSGVTSNVAGSTTFNSFQIASGTTVNLTSTQVFSVIGTFTATGTTSSQIILKTTAGASTAGFIVSTVGTVRYVRATDINSAAGTTVFDLFGTLSNTTNWATYATGDTYWITSTTSNDRLDLYVDGILVASYEAI